MTRREMEACRRRFEAFAGEMLGSLRDHRQGRWGQVYLRGLLLEGRRKSCGAMARRLGEEERDPREQSLQQFISQSPWEWEPVREAMGGKMVGALGAQGCWICDDTGVPKQGTHSVGVARQYLGKLGHQGNGQVAVSISYATPLGAMPLEWALYLPESWTQDAARREEVGIPKEVSFQCKWRLAVGLIDVLLKRGLPRPKVVVADADYGRPTGFREALAARQLHYAFAVEGKLVAWPPVRGERPSSLRAIAQSLPKAAWREVSWREGTKGKLSSRFARVRVCPAHEWEKGRAPGPEVWLLIEWPADQEHPEHYWLSNLPRHTSFRALVRWAKSRWAIELNYREMKSHLGLEHFEGRGWVGWHHHMTLVMLALAFVLLERLEQAKGGQHYPPFPRSWSGRSTCSSLGTASVSPATSRSRASRVTP